MSNNYFIELSQVDCSKDVEKKGQFSYLSWPFAIRELLSKHPDSTWAVREYPLKDIAGVMVPYLHTPLGYFVSVSVTVNGIERTQIHPVLDNRNKVLKSPDSFQINTSIQRALVKAIALHGLGLYIYSGEDLPSEIAEIGSMDGEEIDQDRVIAAVVYFKGMIDEDNPDETAEKMIEAWGRLSNDERMLIHAQLGEKAPDCNKSYKSLLKTHLAYKAE